MTDWIDLAHERGVTIEKMRDLLRRFRDHAAQLPAQAGEHHNLIWAEVANTIESSLADTDKCTGALRAVSATRGNAN